MIKLKLYCSIVLILIYINFQSIQSQDDNAPTFDQNTGCWFMGNNQQSSVDNSIMWQVVQTPVTAAFTDIIFIDSLNGWASHNEMGVIKTTDGGFNWTVTSFYDTTYTTAFNSVHFINLNTGWSVGGALQIRKTTDSGANWIKQYGPKLAGIANSVYFIDANTGYIAGSKKYPHIPFVAKSTDGGNNWVELSPAFASAQELIDQYWFDANTGWLCGNDVLLYTTNGGISFTNLFTNIPPSGNGHISLLAIKFVNQLTGWIGAANLERNNVYKSTNGGLNWVFQSNPVSVGDMNQINDILFLNTDTGWAIHGTPGSGAIMFTVDGGESWVIEELSINWFDCLTNNQNKKLWCGGSYGKVWYSDRSFPIGISGNGNIPVDYKLFQNYPNPFNPTTVISFSIGIPSGQLAVNSFTTLKIYDIVGREVETLLNEQLLPGTYEVDFDGSRYPSGVYYYQLKAGSFINTRKMVLVK